MILLYMEVNECLQISQINFPGRFWTGLIDRTMGGNV